MTVYKAFEIGLRLMTDDGLDGIKSISVTAQQHGFTVEVFNDANESKVPDFVINDESDEEDFWNSLDLGFIED